MRHLVQDVEVVQDRGHQKGGESVRVDWDGKALLTALALRVSGAAFVEVLLSPFSPESLHHQATISPKKKTVASSASASFTANNRYRFTDAGALALIAGENKKKSGAFQVLVPVTCVRSLADVENALKQTIDCDFSAKMRVLTTPPAGWKTLRVVLTMPYGQDSLAKGVHMELKSLFVSSDPSAPAAPVAQLPSLTVGSAGGGSNARQHFPTNASAASAASTKTIPSQKSSPVVSPRSKKIPPRSVNQLGIEAFMKKKGGDKSESGGGWAALAMQQRQQHNMSIGNALRGCSVALAQTDLDPLLRERLGGMVYDLGGELTGGDGSLTQRSLAGATHFVTNIASSAPDFALADSKDGVNVVTAEWLSGCVRDGRRLDERAFFVVGSRIQRQTATGAVDLLRRTLSGGHDATAVNVNLPPARASRADRNNTAIDSGGETDSMDEGEINAARRRCGILVPASAGDMLVVADSGSDTQPMSDEGDVPQPQDRMMQGGDPGGSGDEDDDDDDDDDDIEFLAGTVLFFSPDIPEKRSKRLKGLATAFGARVSAYNQVDVTHIITGATRWSPDFAGAAKDNPGVKFVQGKWIMQCQKQQQRVDVATFTIHPS